MINISNIWEKYQLSLLKGQLKFTCFKKKSVVFNFKKIKLSISKDKKISFSFINNHFIIWFVIITWMCSRIIFHENIENIHYKKFEIVLNSTASDDEPITICKNRHKDFHFWCKTKMCVWIKTDALSWKRDERNFSDEFF